LTNVTDSEQALADHTNGWFFVKDPSTDPGLDKVTTVNGTVMKLDVTSNEEALIAGATGDYNGISQAGSKFENLIFLAKFYANYLQVLLSKILGGAESCPLDRGRHLRGK
jgi:hypothetical protein